MSSLINALLDIDNNHMHCCTKMAIKMNIRHRSGSPLSQLNYYLLFIYYYLITFLCLYIFILSNIIPYTLLYFTIYYIPVRCVIYLSNTITAFMIISSFFIFKQFLKDILCKCPERN